MKKKNLDLKDKWIIIYDDRDDGDDCDTCSFACINSITVVNFDGSKCINSIEII